MIEFNPESAAGSCQETSAGGHAGNSDAPRERVEYGAPGTSARKPGAPSLPDALRRKLADIEAFEDAPRRVADALRAMCDAIEPTK